MHPVEGVCPQRGEGFPVELLLVPGSGYRGTCIGANFSRINIGKMVDHTNFVAPTPTFI